MCNGHQHHLSSAEACLSWGKRESLVIDGAKRQDPKSVFPKTRKRQTPVYKWKFPLVIAGTIHFQESLIKEKKNSSLWFSLSASILFPPYLWGPYHQIIFVLSSCPAGKIESISKKQKQKHKNTICLMDQSSMAFGYRMEGTSKAFESVLRTRSQKSN